MYRQSEKNLLNSNTYSTCRGELRSTSGWDRLTCLGQMSTGFASWQREPNFAALNRDATYIRQGGHHVGHWPTFLVYICSGRLINSNDTLFLVSLEKVSNTCQCSQR